MQGNREIAELLEEIADRLDAREADVNRVRAYREAARNVVDAGRTLQSLYSQKGEPGLQEIRGVGEGLSAVIAEYLETGRSTLRDDLAAEADSVQMFRQLPGISEKLARRTTRQLGAHTLEELELAAHDGRLKEVRGFGPQRVQTVKEVLAGRLSRSDRSRTGQSGGKAQEPPVSLLLEIDREYREKAEAGQLKKIASRRFNPERETWLPLLEEDRRGWDFTALFSNTSRAHELQKTRDWVVIYYRRGRREGQSTVVTATRGELAGERVVRGRERECSRYYRSS
jgi:hypothetical protein